MLKIKRIIQKLFKKPTTNWEKHLNHDILVRHENGKYSYVRLAGILDTAYPNRYLLECYVHDKKLLEYYFIDETEFIHDTSLHYQIRKS